MAHDKKLSDRGIACWLETSSDGVVRLVMDDIERADPATLAGWRTKILFTWRDYDEAHFLRTDLTEGELADVGLNVVSRLAALAQRRCEKPER